MLPSNSKVLAQKVKKCLLTLAHHHNASHVGGALSIADVLSVLYSRILKYDTSRPKWEERDRLLYSKGHACTALYAVLKEVGFYTDAALQTFTQNGSLFTSHVNHKVAGVELSTGSLGHALSVACGMALAGKRKKMDWHVYTIVSDGELNEGSNWEAILFAPHHELNNMTLIVDFNKIQSFGTIKEVLDLDPLKDKFNSFGWDTIEIDGHNHSEIYEALRKDTIHGSKPRVVIAHTVKGKGVDFMENQLAWHYKSPNKEQLESAIGQINQQK
jgi:transketolase